MGTIIGILATVAAVPLGAMLLGGLLVWVYMRYATGGKVGPSPVHVNPGAAVSLFQAALAGNKPMVIDALRKAFELDLQSSPVTDIISEWALDDIQKRMKDPAHPALIINAIAKFTGLTPEEVFSVVQADFTPKPAAPANPTAVIPVPAVAVATTTAILLVLCSSDFSHARGAMPQTWGMEVTGPQRFYERSMLPANDTPLKRDRSGQLIPMGDCVLPDKGPTIYVDYFFADWCTDCAQSSLLADNLRSKGYDVLKINAGTDGGAKTARAYRVTSVPFWIVKEDGREILRTNDSQRVTTYLNSKNVKSRQVSATPVQPPDGSYYRPAQYQACRGNSTNWYAGKIVGAPFRWFAHRRWRLFGRRC